MRDANTPLSAIELAIAREHLETGEKLQAVHRANNALNRPPITNESAAVQATRVLNRANVIAYLEARNKEKDDQVVTSKADNEAYFIKTRDNSSLATRDRNYAAECLNKMNGWHTPFVIQTTNEDRWLNYKDELRDLAALPSILPSDAPNKGN